MALPLTMFVLAILGALIGSVLWATHIEARAAAQLQAAMRVREAAEVAWMDLASGAGAHGVPSLPLGDSLTIAPIALSGGVMAQAVAFRLSATFVLIQATGTISGPQQAVSDVQMMARFDTVPSGAGTAVVLAPLPGSSWSSLPPYR